MSANAFVSAGSFLRRFRRRRRLALPGAARNPLLLVSDLARPGRGGRAGQQADRRRAASAHARRCRARGAALRSRGAAHLDAVLRLRCPRRRSAQGGQSAAEGRLRRRQGRGRAAGEPGEFARHRFRRRQRIRFHHQGGRRRPRLERHRRAVLSRCRRRDQAQSAARHPRKHGRTAVRHAGLQARPEDRELFHRLSQASLHLALYRARLQIALHLLPVAANGRRPSLPHPQRRQRRSRRCAGPKRRFRK